ncbi:MAG: adenylyl-sulfate kinase [Alphaproteobacteria bacterium]|nr:adenylyl-sulfate kinase [Alphaproteobacteria bacterium]
MTKQDSHPETDSKHPAADPAVLEDTANSAKEDNASRILLVMGLPGAGKTTLSRQLAPMLNAVHLNADDVRREINRDLGFSRDDRIEHARRMRWLCDQVTSTGGYAIADFVCPTPETRAAFGPCRLIFVDRIREGRFADTNAMFVAPSEHSVDFRVTEHGSALHWANRIMGQLMPRFDWKKPTALFLGRYQPFHEGHLKLMKAGLERVGQICVAVRSTHGIDDKNPFPFEEVRARIEASLHPYREKYVIISIPNITDVFYGRDVGYNVERIDLDEATHAISATGIRRELAG